MLQIFRGEGPSGGKVCKGEGLQYNTGTSGMGFPISKFFLTCNFADESVSSKRKPIVLLETIKCTKTVRSVDLLSS